MSCMEWVVTALRFERISSVEFHFLRKHFAQLLEELDQKAKTKPGDLDQHGKAVSVESNFNFERDSLAVLSLCYSLLGLDPITDQRQFVTNSTPTAILTVKYSWTFIAGEGLEMLKCQVLEVIQKVHRKMEKATVFQHWTLHLPDASFNPYRVSILEEAVRTIREPGSGKAIGSAFMSEIHAFLEKVSFHFAFIEKPKSQQRRGFTPVYQSLGASLTKSVELLADVLNYLGKYRVNSGQAGDVSKCLLLLMRLVPFRKLKTNPLKSVLEAAEFLVKGSDNPVTQIIGINLFLGLAGVEEQSRPIKDDEIASLFIYLAFSNEASRDNNVRYVVLQGLCTMVSNNKSLALSICCSLHQTIDSPYDDDDISILLHTLRLVKAISKSCSEVDSTKRMDEYLSLWMALLKPRRLALLENKQENLLKSAFCDCLSEMSEFVYVNLPQDMRVMVITYLLNHSDEEASVNVRNSSMRGLGVLVSFDISSTDTSLLMDCSDRIFSALHDGSKCKHLITNATWAMANLGDTLLSLAAANPSGQQQEIGYPMHYVLKLLRLTTDFLNNPASHVNTKVNCLRSAGCLLLCYQSYMVPDLPQDAEKDLLEIVKNSVSSIFESVRMSSVMKVKWNGFYVLSKIVQKDELVLETGIDQEIVNSVMEAMDNCENFKVQINAALVLINLKKRSYISTRFDTTVKLLVKSIEKTSTNEDPSETKHKIDLVDTLCLAICNLIILSTPQDLKDIDRILQPDEVAQLSVNFHASKRRVSPERASLFLDAERHLEQNLKQQVRSEERPFCYNLVSILEITQPFD